MTYSDEAAPKTWAQVRVDDRIKAADGSIWHIVKRGPNADGPTAMVRVNADGSLDKAQTVGSPPAANAVHVFAREGDVAPATEAEAVANVVEQFPATETASGAKAADVLAKVEAEGTPTAPVVQPRHAAPESEVAALLDGDDMTSGRTASKCCDECGRHALAIGNLTARVARLETGLKVLTAGLVAVTNELQ